MRERPPEKELRERWKKFRRLLKERKKPAVLLSAPADVRWLSGFTGDEAALLATSTRRFLLTDFRYVEEAEKTAPGWQVRTAPDGLPALVGRTAKKLGLDELVFDSFHLRVHLLKLLRRATRGVKWTAAPRFLRSLRIVKSAWEVRRIEQALRIQEKCFPLLCRMLKPGVTEREAAAELRRLLVREGAEDEAFQSIVQFGTNSSLPHGRPTRRRLRSSSVVLIDWGARCAGYHSDLTRTFFLGNIPRKLHSIHDLVLEAQAAAVNAIRPGVTCEEVDAAAREIITKAGYGREFGHAAGHGLGLEVHEAPVLAPRAGRAALVPGMVATVEPGIYLPGVGGVRIEDDVLVTKTGRRVLSRLPRGVRWDEAARPGFSR